MYQTNQKIHSISSNEVENESEEFSLQNEWCRDQIQTQWVNALTMDFASVASWDPRPVANFQSAEPLPKQVYCSTTKKWKQISEAMAIAIKVWI